MVGDSVEKSSPEDHYDNNQANFHRLRGEVEFALQTAMSTAGVKLHSISARVKERRSYLEKIKKKVYDDPVEDIEDVVGGRAVCLFITDLPKMRGAVASVFDILSEDDKISSAPSDAFGYMSVHYICRLKVGTSGPRYDGLMGFKFEVQCRTILMDAWANVSHYLAYKGEASIPDVLRKDFNALAGLFYVADKHFELLYESSRKSDAAAMQEYTESGEVDGSSRAHIRLDRSTMLAYLASKFPDRDHGDPELASELVQDAVRLGIETVGELDELVTSVMIEALKHEEEFPPSPEDGADDEDAWGEHRFWSVGFVRVAFAIARPDDKPTMKWLLKRSDENQEWDISDTPST